MSSSRRSGGPASGRGDRPIRAEALLDLANDIASLHTLADQLDALVKVICREVGSERATLFVHDAKTKELFGRVTEADRCHEIRLADTEGIVGHVFHDGRSLIVNDAYADARFNAAIDDQTGFRTQGIICAPVRTPRGDLIGVTQALNSVRRKFSDRDLRILEAINLQVSTYLQSTLLHETMRRSRAQEAELLGIVTDVSTEIQLEPLLRKIMETIQSMLGCERATLFLNDERTRELYNEVSLDGATIRFPNHVGLAGAVFTSGKSINIPHAYADLRFNPAFDRTTSYFTRSMLCVPVINKRGKIIGVTQVLNKRGRPFDAEDEQRLRAFSAQITMGLENARLFEDVQDLKNYAESMLESMSNGVVTFDGHGRFVRCNASAQRLLSHVLGGAAGTRADEVFNGPNAWIAAKIARVEETRTSDVTVDAELTVGDDKLSVNATVVPLTSTKGDSLGSMLLLDDISAEKRVKATMSRYMDPLVADRLLAKGQEILGGQSRVASVLFSDVRDFTTLTEELGAQGTVQLLNEYFTVMVDCIAREGGMLDKFIGDAIMAVFGTPLRHEDDEDRSVRAAITMMTELAAFNRARGAEGQKPVRAGIGIATDTIVSGNIGSPRRMDYTVIGDGVNLAARLESACKHYGTDILVSGTTHTKLRGGYRTRLVDRVVVKGKTEPVDLFEVLDHHTEETFPRMDELLPRFAQGLADYRAARFDRALDAFADGQRVCPADGLTAVYVERCRRLAEQPPDDWRGVWVLASK